jgi:murein DD-endopeptidase MepM/ murein hydrolase activator NlpD
MVGRKRTVVVIPPFGRRVRLVRIRLSLCIGAAALLLAGFSGYFLPYNHFALDVVELNQKRNLAEQNKMLLERIVEMRNHLMTVREQVGQLEQKQRNVMTMLHGSSATESTPAAKAPLTHSASLGIGELLETAKASEALINAIAAFVDSQPTWFSSRPVLLPVVGKAVVSATFGKTADPFTGKIKLHQGIDFVAPRETPVIATADGIVKSVENDTRHWGLRVVIEHSSTFSSLYAHLGSIHTTRGSRVKRGQLIGTVGTSGLSSGPHLHYEIHKNGRAVDPQLVFYPTLRDSLTLMAGSGSVLR